MNQADILLEIEVRAKRLRLPMYNVCREAGIHPTTFSKWKNGVDARISGIAKLSAALDKLESFS